jgi:hypothetical protein
LPPLMALRAVSAATHQWSLGDNTDSFVRRGTR